MCPTFIDKLRDWKSVAVGFQCLESHPSKGTWFSFHNNAATVKDVAVGCRRHLANVLVVDDGSTDVDVAALFADTDVEVLTHEVNRGKGAALLSALSHVHEKGGRWMLCVDADGQHHPDDIPAFFQPMEESPESIIIGARDFSVPNVPDGSKFGRKFSNFWIKAECGAVVSDSQSGFRAYPVDYLSQMKFRGNRYDFEVEVLTKAVWAGLSLVEVPIGVFYAPKAERISHFHKFKDNFLLTHRHATLISRKIIPWPHRRLVKPGETDWQNMVRHPRKFLSLLLQESSTPHELGAAAGVGILLATLPLVFCHTVVILWVTTRLKLNRLLAVNVQHLCAPPFVPLACIELGFFMRNGSWIGREELRTVASDLHQHILNWLLGSLVLAPVLALLAGVTVYFIAFSVQRKVSWKDG